MWTCHITYCNTSGKTSKHCYTNSRLKRPFNPRGMARIEPSKFDKRSYVPTKVIATHLFTRQMKFERNY
jgi:hypothetical protein